MDNARKIARKLLEDMPTTTGEPFANMGGVVRELRKQGYYLQRTAFGMYWRLTKTGFPNSFVEFAFQGGGPELAAAIQKRDLHNPLKGLVALLKSKAVWVHYNSLSADLAPVTQVSTRLKNSYASRGYAPNLA